MTTFRRISPYVLTLARSRPGALEAAARHGSERRPFARVSRCRGGGHGRGTGPCQSTRLRDKQKAAHLKLLPGTVSTSTPGRGPT